MESKEIIITKANQHNLKNISLSIPKNSFVVITGPSGSGKSSLAFDTLYAEGQRRYIESLSAYARQFLEQYDPPNVESIEGLSPAIAIDQTSINRNPRSTVGTVTEIYNYLKLLFARIGKLYCPESGNEIKSYSPTQITNIITALPLKTKIQILAPQQELNESIISKFLTMGFSRIRLGNEIHYLDSISDDLMSKPFEVIVDRIIVKDGIQSRVFDSVEYALRIGFGIVVINIDDKDHFYSELNRSPISGKIYPKLEPNLFAFNSAVGACPKCNGIGQQKSFLEESLIFDSNLSINNGAIIPLQKKKSFLYKMVNNVAATEKIDLDKPLKTLSKQKRALLFNGSNKKYNYKFKSDNSSFEFSGEFEGIIPWLTKKYFSANSIQKRVELENIMNIEVCSGCNGLKLNETALQTKISDLNIAQLCELPLSDLSRYFQNLQLTDEDQAIAHKLLKEITSRIQCLCQLGLDYLTLSRTANTLSGGEAQRIKLASQLGSALSGIIYVLDEPSIGLHQSDNLKLLDVLHNLKDLGNSVIVVEHDSDTIKAADHLVDLGPGAGVNGGKLLYTGHIQELENVKNSLTSDYLFNRKNFPKRSYLKTDSIIQIKGASLHNIINLDVSIPKNVLTCVTGVSGSGKSTLINNILFPAVKNLLNSNIRTSRKLKYLNSLTGISDYKDIVVLDQSPIGKNSKSNPATFTSIFDEIRTIFANTPDAKIRGFKSGRFSFNIKGGRCEECEGLGDKKIEMHFLPDVFIRCPECHGKRYNSDTLNILYKGKSIFDILDLTVDECIPFFKNYSKISRVLVTMSKLGLGYLKLGQPAPTLSGGEAQRLKLCRELAKKTRGNCLYLLDEPTTGLHYGDIELLIKCLYELIDAGHTVITIEHNIDLIRCCDYVIDMGPGGGASGGKIVAQGTPQEIALQSKSLTGKFLKESE